MGIRLRGLEALGVVGHSVVGLGFGGVTVVGLRAALRPSVLCFQFLRRFLPE